MSVKEGVEQQVTQAMRRLLGETRRYADTLPRKVTGMLEAYLRLHGDEYQATEAESLWYSLKTSLHKYYMATLALEQMWCLSHNNRAALVDAIENSLDTLDCADDDLVLASFALECALFEFNAFLDVYMLYITQLLRCSPITNMTQTKFYKALDRVRDGPHCDRACEVKCYFESKVFAAESNQTALVDPAWGSILRSLRDRVAHRDQIRPSFQGQEKLVDKVLFNWPTLRGLTYDRFVQSLQNGAFFVLGEDIAPHPLRSGVESRSFHRRHVV